uniref:Uncharacterized protein n=1 Tax=uncultured bacterium CBNPD1 BAC clone 1664 TaxID=417310 RepID=B1N6M9_9BACT|nr:conserved hypothetical protein [uncultured bacterium CBNPD1 BAC clone 1664]
MRGRWTGARPRAGGGPPRLVREDHRLAAVQEDPVLQHPAHRPGQHPALDVAALAHQVLRLVAVADPLHVLLDDRALIEVGGDEVGGGADHLHPPGVGLMIGPRALEAGQEGVVDVDASAGQVQGHVLGQDLHVARQDDEVGPRGGDQGAQAGLLVGLGLGAHRQVVEGDALEIRMRKTRLRVVGDHRRDIHGQLALPPAPDQVGQAVIGLRGQDHHPSAGLGVAQAPVHGKVGGQGLQPRTHRLRPAGAGGEDHPHEETAGLGVVELLGVDDVGAVLEEQGGDAGDDAGPVGTGQGEDHAGAPGNGAADTAKGVGWEGAGRPPPATPEAVGIGPPGVLWIAFPPGRDGTAGRREVGSEPAKQDGQDEALNSLQNEDGDNGRNVQAAQRRDNALKRRQDRRRQGLQNPVDPGHEAVAQVQDVEGRQPRHDGADDDGPDHHVDEAAEDKVQEATDHPRHISRPPLCDNPGPPSVLTARPQNRLFRAFLGAVAQLVERIVRNDEVRGSTPLGSTRKPPPDQLPAI